MHGETVKFRCNKFWDSLQEHTHRHTATGWWRPYHRKVEKEMKYCPKQGTRTETLTV